MGVVGVAVVVGVDAWREPINRSGVSCAGGAGGTNEKDKKDRYGMADVA